MKPLNRILFLGLILLITLSCNTLYNNRYIDIEIVEPGKMQIPQNIKKVAVRYNNCNVAKHSYLGYSFLNDQPIEQKENLDSIASLVYFKYFVDEIKKQNFFDSVVLVNPGDYSKIKVVDTIQPQIISYNDSDIIRQEDIEKLYVSFFSNAISAVPNKYNFYDDSVYLHPRTGLYSPSELEEIADTTGADILVSLDYFASIDAVFTNKLSANEAVYVQAYWNFYDLKNLFYYYYKNKRDTIHWSEERDYNQSVYSMLPPPKDAVLNSAEMTGTEFAHFLIPHWITVQRMYYGSGHVELQKTDQLIKNGNWMEAAKIWKANTSNPNKNIAAKCKYNMGLACEMEGDLKAALEWIVESYYTLGDENKEHATNCMRYIQILSQRKQDMRIIEHQLNE